MSYFASRIGFEWHGSKLGVVCWECSHVVGRRRGNLRQLDSLYAAVGKVLIRHYEKHHPTRLETVAIGEHGDMPALANRPEGE